MFKCAKLTTTYTISYAFMCATYLREHFALLLKLVSHTWARRIRRITSAAICIIHCPQCGPVLNPIVCSVPSTKEKREK